MSEFVNYNKRDVSLPPGCKDLVDVLRRRSERQVGSLAASDKAPAGGSETVTGTVSQSHKYIDRAFSSDARYFILVIVTQDEGFMVEFSKFWKKPATSMVLFSDESKYDQPVRQFFASNELSIPEKTGVPKQFFFPEVPVLTHYDIAPLPLESSHASDLIMRLFRAVCKTQDKDQVRFHYTWLE